MNTPSSLPLVIDIGMFDTADTCYYLETGHRVIAVEANPRLASRGAAKLHAAVSEARLEIINAAIAPSRERVTLTVNGDNAGGSSVIPGMVDATIASGSYDVEGVTMADVLARAGQRARLVKIDIEGADGLCIEAINAANRPEFLSVEAHSRCEEFIGLLSTAGFTRFKLIDQVSFRAVENMGNLHDKIAMKLVRLAGFAEPHYRKRNGRFFSHDSSGPAPWCSDGRWHTAREAVALWAVAQEHIKRRNVWFDIHAS
jgi:FkbM family methyltransferase